MRNGVIKWVALVAVLAVLRFQAGCVTGSGPTVSPSPTPSASPTPTAEPQGRDSLLYLLQPAGIEAEEIADAGFTWVVLEPSRDGDRESEFSAGEVATIQAGGACGAVTVLAYLSVGEAEDYRDYWDAAWVDEAGAPVEGVAPAWLGAANPDWPGNYKVRYWDEEWQALILGTPAGESATPLDRIIDAGYDGVYLDIVDAYAYWSGPEGGGELTRAEARRRMVEWVERIGNYARTQRGVAGFLVFPQNAAEIVVDEEGAVDTLGERYLAAVSGIGIEDLYYNETSANETDEIAYGLGLLAEYRARDKVVLVTDYVVDAAQSATSSGARVADFVDRSRAEGFLPYAAIANRDLDEIVVLPGSAWPISQPVPCEE